jgi:glycosyltransferase involved in cell wall biosynthesis
MLKQPTVHILLATYNGERFLAEQLESIARQTYDCWTLTVSDDGSADNTLGIVQSFASKVHQPVTLLQGPQKRSSTANFFHLIANAPIDSNSDLYAFCDQDDVWFEDKLERAVKWHLQHTDQQVRLYCGRTQFADDKLLPIGLSPNIQRPPSFGNALVQNIASGNTMVFSYAVLTSQKRVLPEHSVWHDWTTYIVTTALDGVVWFDDEPCLSYRQHSGNVIGSNDGLKSQIARLKPLFNGRFKNWGDRNCAAAHDLLNVMPRKTISTLRNFESMRATPSPILRVLGFLKSDIRRQRRSSNLLLALALMLKLC